MKRVYFIAVAFCLLIGAVLVLEINIASAKTLYSSKGKVTVSVGQTVTVNITYKKNGTISCLTKNKKIVTTVWGKDWNGNKIKLKIKGKKVGSTKLVITNSKNNEKAVIRVEVKKKVKLNEKARKALKIPKKATYTFSSYMVYWDGGSCYMRHIEVNGTGKYKGYIAFADFTLDYSDYKSIFLWSRN